MRRPARVSLDLNVPEFQRQLFELTDEEYLSVRATFLKLLKLTWDEVYRDKGLRWELIHSRRADSGERLYSIRVNRRFRAVVRRADAVMRFLALAPDHDSAYE